MRLSLGIAAIAGLFFASSPAAQAQTVTIEVTSVPTDHPGDRRVSRSHGDRDDRQG
jgi:hypothetical protein